MSDMLSRRALLQRSAALGAVALSAAACGKKTPALSCADTTGMSPTDVQLRTTLAYMDYSTEPGKTCSGCQQFVAPPGPNTCGTCKVLKGPVNPAGYCKSFVAKPA